MSKKKHNIIINFIREDGYIKGENGVMGRRKYMRIIKRSFSGYFLQRYKT